MLAVALLCVAGAAYWWWRLVAANSTEPPLYPGAWPILGHAPMLIGNSCTLWDRCKGVGKNITKMGGVVRSIFGPRTVYVITDPDDGFTLANTCLEKDFYYSFAKEWLGNGLVTARYATWKNHRKLLNPAFSQILLDTFMDIFNSQSKKLVKDLEKEAGKGLFDHLIYMRKNALETVCMTAFGVNFTDANLNSDYVKAVDLIFASFMERFMKIWWHKSAIFAWSNLKKKQDAYIKTLHTMSNTVLQKRKSAYYENTCADKNTTPETKIKPFIDLLLELSIEKGVLNDKDIRDHVDTFLVAGYDTSANVLMFTMILLGSYPEAQEKVFAEIQEILGEERDVKKTDLSKMVYLEAVLKESMRIYPVGPFIARRLDTDVKLKNCTLSAGRTCIIFFFEIQTHPIWGPDAHEFKPERWLEPGRLPENLNAFAAFGMGKRNCIGKTYAMMSMKTTLAHVVRRYRIKADHTKLRTTVDTILKPASGYYISIDSRT